MAATKRTTKTEEAKETRAVAKKGKENTEVMSPADMAALAAMASQNAQMDGAVRGEDGVNVQFISIAQQLSKALDEEEKDLFIEGLKLKEFYVQSKKLRIGPKLRAVPIAFITCYTEYSGPGPKAKFLGIWHKDDAAQYPLALGSYFNKELPNGNELRPTKWVVLYLPDHPEIDRPVIAFKSTGNKTAKAWSKNVDANGGVSSQLLYDLLVKTETSDDGKNKWYQVSPEIIGKVYEIDDDGNLDIIEPFAPKVIAAAHQINKMYLEGTLIPRRGPAVAGTRHASQDDDDDDDDDDVPTF